MPSPLASQRLIVVLESRGHFCLVLSCLRVAGAERGAFVRFALACVGVGVFHLFSVC